VPNNLPLLPTLPDLPSQPETDSVDLPLPPAELNNDTPPPIEEDWGVPIAGSEEQPPQESEIAPQIELTEEEKQAIEEKNRHDAASLIQAYIRTYYALIDFENKKQTNELQQIHS